VPYAVNNTTLSYLIHCYTNLPDKSSGLNPQITKLAQLPHVASLQDCITQCAVWNHALDLFAVASAKGTGAAAKQVPFESLCSGVVYYYLDAQIQCQLSSGVRENATRVMFGPAEVDSAVLQWSE
jgi:hypothetical protein